jgi:hypothetical protein
MAQFEPVPKKRLSVGDMFCHDFDMIRPTPDQALTCLMLTKTCRRRGAAGSAQQP